jgi:hypothetical protein
MKGIHMKIHRTASAVLATFIALLTTIEVLADPLRFTSGTLSGTSVTLNLAGNSNLVCEVQRLDFPSDTWVAQGNLTLNSVGTGTFNSSVTNGLGYFRARSTNNAFLSTNAFGSLVGTIPSGYWLLGNPFPPLTVSQMFPSPVGGTTVYYLLPDGSFPAVSWDDLDSVWSPEDRSISMGEGFLVASGTTNNFPFQIYGLFATNTFSRNLWTNWSILTSPLYHKYPGGSATQIDQFNTNRLGGLEILPVTSASNPQSRVSRNKNGVANQYNDYTLTTGNQWQLSATNTVVPILIGEGYFYDNLSGTNRTWTVPLKIW